MGEIEEILAEQLKQGIESALRDEDKVFEAAEKLIDEQLKHASIRMAPSANGFTLMLCGTDLECKYDEQIEAFANDGFDLGTLLKVKDALKKWQDKIDEEIDKARDEKREYNRKM